MKQFIKMKLSTVLLMLVVLCASTSIAENTTSNVDGIITCPVNKAKWEQFTIKRNNYKAYIDDCFEGLKSNYVNGKTQDGMTINQMYATLLLQYDKLIVFFGGPGDNETQEDKYIAERIDFVKVYGNQPK